MNSNWANRLQFSNDRDFLPEKKLQYRLWHIFALTAVVAAVCAFPLVAGASVATCLIILLGYLLTYGFLLLCRAGLALSGVTFDQIASRFKQPPAEDSQHDEEPKSLTSTRLVEYKNRVLRD